jgi:hypothetical protein
MLGLLLLVLLLPRLRHRGCETPQHSLPSPCQHGGGRQSW